MIEVVETRKHLTHVRLALESLRRARQDLELAAAEARIASAQRASAECDAYLGEALELERLRGSLELVAGRLIGRVAAR